MNNIKNDKYYILKTINEIQIIKEYSKNIKDYDDFLSDEKGLDAIMFRLIQMIENIKNISPEFKNEHSDIPWGNILGFRNGIVHEYGETDYSDVYEIVMYDIVKLEKDLKTAI